MEETKTYSIIYADPPWTFKTYSDKGKDRSAEKHYKTMTKESIQRLNVAALASDDCVLFIWVTFPTLPEGLELINKWGFTYKTCAFNWVKRNKKKWSWFWGMGYWTRSNSEICLLATKGNPARIARNVHQIIEERIEKHSKKPDIVRQKIVELVGDLPRIELFAREQHHGWDSFGDQLENSVIIKPLLVP